MSIAAGLASPLMRGGYPQSVRRAQSGDEHYRWSLSRCWERSETSDWLPWIMLNPSTADGERDDPTLKRITQWTYRWGFPGLLVYNVFPFRTPSPKELAATVVGWDERSDWWVRDTIWRNYDRISGRLLHNDAVMVAWGSPSGALGFETEMWAEQLFDTINEPDGARERSIDAWCLGTTKGGDPIHPMARGKHRVPDDARPQPYRNPGTVTFGPSAPSPNPEPPSPSPPPPQGELFDATVKPEVAA